DDPLRARTALATQPTVAAPALRSPVLATDLGAQRFEAELAALEGEGYEVRAAVGDRGVDVVLRHGELQGEVTLTIPSEGFERPPRVAIKRASGKSEHVAAPLANFFSGWSSAFALLDLVRFMRSRTIWPRVP